MDYRTTKKFSVAGLAKSDVCPTLFKEMIGFWSCSPVWEASEEYNPEFIPVEFTTELLRLGYIEEVVHDPVIKVGDCFKSDDGILYKIFGWGDDLKMASVNQDYQTVITVKKGENRLSDFIVGEKLKCFTPCKIEIREVEE